MLKFLHNARPDAKSQNQAIETIRTEENSKLTVRFSHVIDFVSVSLTPPYPHNDSHVLSSALKQLEIREGEKLSVPKTVPKVEFRTQRIGTTYCC